MPTVSVIVPNYCHAPYLEQRIESILQQTFQDFELILLDDCSTDGSREILERYRNHPKVSGIFYNERNSGSPFKQWKKGLSKATGDYVWIAESDDFSSPCFLERCVRILDTRPDCSIVFTSSYIVDSHSRTIREEAPVKYPKHKQIRFGSRFFLYRFLCPRNTIYNAGMALVRRSALPAGDNYTQYRYCGDWLFWIQIVSGGGNVVYLAEPLNYYRVHDSNTTAESIATGRKHIETLRILEETFRLIDPPLICRLSIAGKHLLRIRKAAGSHWNEEPYLSVRLAWRERLPSSPDDNVLAQGIQRSSPQFHPLNSPGIDPATTGQTSKNTASDRYLPFPDANCTGNGKKELFL